MDYVCNSVEKWRKFISPYNEFFKKQTHDNNYIFIKKTTENKFNTNHREPNWRGVVKEVPHNEIKMEKVVTKSKNLIKVFSRL